MKNEQTLQHLKQSFDDLKTNGRLKKEQTYYNTNKSVAENEKNEKSTGKKKRGLAAQNASAHSPVFTKRKRMETATDLVLVREAVTAKAEAEKTKLWNNLLYFRQYHRCVRLTKFKGLEESENEQNMKQTKKEDERAEGVCSFMSER